MNSSAITRAAAARTANAASNLASVSRAGAFDDDDVTHVEGELDPVRDLDIISNELRLKDIELLSSAIEKLEKNAMRTNDKKLKAEFVSETKRRHAPALTDTEAGVSAENQVRSCGGQAAHSLPRVVDERGEWRAATATAAAATLTLLHRLRC